MTEFERGWTAALLAAQAWHEDRAKQVMVLARRARFPKALEQQADTHRQAAELIITLIPEPADLIPKQETAP